ncbi:MAG: hypothetical protein JNM56_25740 [Planctomycetia bacterium]|nr:hypothetical protein [Planctomycetia bacterium]
MRLPDSLGHCCLKGRLKAQVLQELALDRPGFGRPRIALEDKIHDGHAAATGSRRKVVAGHFEQARFRLALFLFTEHLREQIPATRTALISAFEQVAALQAGITGRGKQRPDGGDDQGSFAATGTFPGDSKYLLLSLGKRRYDLAVRCSFAFLAMVALV